MSEIFKNNSLIVKASKFLRSTSKVWREIRTWTMEFYLNDWIVTKSKVAWLLGIYKSDITLADAVKSRHYPSVRI